MPLAKPPPKLKPIMPFITRAHQIDKVDPVIAYWCYYWAVQIILSGSLHTGDAECTAYTTALLDDLEARKDKLLPNDAVTDDLAAQAYVENFAMRVFNNADNALQARKVSRQTADNFLAAATFLELCKVFNADPEILAKIKFAKYQASRIIKAVQAGEDPNLPLPASKSEILQPAETIEYEKPSTGTSLSPPRPSVEEVLDEDLPHRSVSMIQAPPRPRLASSPTASVEIRPPSQSMPTPERLTFHEPQSTLADNEYFSTVSVARSFPPLNPARSSNNTPQDVHSPFHQPGRADRPVHPPPPDTIQTEKECLEAEFPHTQYPSAPPLPQFPPQHFDQSSTLHSRPIYPSSPPPLAPTSILPTSPPPNLQTYYVSPSPASSAPSVSNSSYYETSKPPPPPPAMVDDETIAKAQRHAKWAISALNFEDIPTAVKELRLALQTLGAS
ncbi:Vta1 like-domain-containing protein [Kalaharituber pfeilii]|nr:Vta1 like-domain-containing protein [Kalaharituber pfeilii]